jgi:hypothetical protein
MNMVSGQKLKFPFCFMETTHGPLHLAKAKAAPLHAMKALGGESRYSSYSFFTLALDGGEWSASCPTIAFREIKLCTVNDHQCTYKSV